MRVFPTELPEVLIVEPAVFQDARGFFFETYHAERYRAHGIAATFVQDNHSRSVARTIRGLHLQVGRPQAKLIRAIAGTIWDVAADVRRGSPTFGQWVGVELSAENHRQCYIPAGFAHGFCVLSDAAEVVYKCSDFYDPASELGIVWDDRTLGITWPIAEPLLSERDRCHSTLDLVSARLPSMNG